MDRVIIAKGHGYETGPQGRCTAFDGFDVIAEPLPTRESRILGRVDGKPGTGTDYGAYSIKLAVRASDSTYKSTRQLYLLMENGSGREVLAIKTMYDRGETERALLALPEGALYGALFIMWEMATAAARCASGDTAKKWADAYRDGRIRKRRARGGVQRIEIESDWEAEARKRRAAA